MIQRDPPFVSFGDGTGFVVKLVGCQAVLCKFAIKQDKKQAQAVGVAEIQNSIEIGEIFGRFWAVIQAVDIDAQPGRLLNLLFQIFLRIRGVALVMAGYTPDKILPSDKR